MCVCVKVCVCVHANWLKWGVTVEMANCKKMHNVHMDSWTCARFSGKAGHEPKDG